MWKFLLGVVLGVSLTSCMETKTNDGVKAYRYWSGNNPPNDVKIIRGQYWESGHWSKEYILYLNFNASEQWISGFISQNRFQLDKETWVLPTDCPSWFKPSEKSTFYKSTNIIDTHSRLIKDLDTGEYWLYLIQL